MDFNGKVALITGAAVGIGRACAIVLAQKGASVIIADINKKELDKTEQEIKAITESVISVVCDVSDNTQVTDTVNAALERFGKIDILINNAALWRCWAPFIETDIEEWRKFLDVNVLGTVYFTKTVLKDMLKRNYGRIINVASVAGVYGNANMVHYSATKGAIISFTKALAKEVADKGVTVNAVSPGSVSPSENRDLDHFEKSEHCFTGRTGTDRENADLICFLSSDQAGYISGQNIQIDGCRKKQ